MPTRYLLTFLENIRTSLWFIPTLMSLAAVALSYLVPELDRRLGSEPKGDWLELLYYSGEAAGARTVLGAIAGSMITVAGTVFSITIVALSLATSQFGPRLLRNFLSDRGNQAVLGTFVSTFLYCILVMREVHGGEDEGASFVPAIAISIAVVLGVASLGVLIYFIHHIAKSMQAGHIVHTVEQELSAQIETMFPDASSHHQPTGRADPEQLGPLTSVIADCSGYLQAIDTENLVQLAARHDLVIVALLRPGEFVIPGEPIAQLSAEAELTAERQDELSRGILSMFIVGVFGTPRQNIEFGIDQIVEVAVRALSPGINDPFTAISCVDRLGATLARLVTRDFPDGRHLDQRGRARLMVKTPSFGDLVDAAFHQIRQNAQHIPAVIIRLTDTLGRVGALTQDAARLRALRGQLDTIAEGSHLLEASADRQDLKDRLAAAYRATAPS